MGEVLWKQPMIEGAKGTAAGASYYSIIAGIVNGLMNNITSTNKKKMDAMAANDAAASASPTFGQGQIPKLSGREYGEY